MYNKKKYEAKQKSDNLPELDENFEMKEPEKDQNEYNFLKA